MMSMHDRVASVAKTTRPRGLRLATNSTVPARGFGAPHDRGARVVLAARRVRATTELTRS